MKRWTLLFVLLAAACTPSRQAAVTAVPTNTLSGFPTLAAPPTWTPKPPTLTPIPTPTFRNWFYIRGVDWPTGTEEYVAVVANSETILFYDDLYHTPELWIRCRDKKIDVYVFTATYISSDPDTVQYQFDQRPSWTAQLPLSADRTTIFLNPSWEWMQAISASQRLLVRWTPYRLSKLADDPPTEATFNLTGFDDLVKPVIEACK